MKDNFLTKTIFSFFVPLIVLIIIFYIADGTRFYALTYDGIRYLFESQVERGINYAFSLESYFYRFFIFQLGKIFSSFTSLQNFHFFLFCLVFLQSNYLFLKHSNFWVFLAFNTLMLLNFYANGIIFVVERETLLSIITFGFFSLTLPIYTKKLNRFHYILMLTYATAAPLIKFEGILLFIGFLFLHCFLSFSNKIKVLCISTSLIFIFSFNFIFTHHGLKEARGNYFSTVLIKPLSYILSKKNKSGTLEKDELENITQIYNKETIILKENIHNIPVINIYYKKKLNHIDQKLSLELKTLPLIFKNLDLLLEVSWINFISSLNSFYPHGYTKKSFFFNDGYNDPYIDYYYLKTSIENLKRNLNKNIYHFTKTIHQFYKSTGIYFLFTTPMSIILNLFLLFLLSLKKRWDLLTIFIAFFFMNLGVILLAPNDNARYYYHLVFVNPLLWIFTFINVNKFSETSNK